MVFLRGQFTSRLLLCLWHVLESEVRRSGMLLGLLLLCKALAAGEASIGLSDREEAFGETGGGLEW